MQRLINNPTCVVEDMLRGYLRAHTDMIAATQNPRVLRAIHAPNTRRVGIVTGGGSGHKPCFIGYLGKGLLDAAAIGDIFSPPSVDSFYDAITAADMGEGVACLYGNYAADRVNCDRAVERAKKMGIRVECVVANDDVASASREKRDRRRASAGTVLMWKAGGACAAAGGDLDEVIRVAQKAVDQTCSVGVGLSSCTIPAVGKPNFYVADGTMEIGIGHHGEQGVRVERLRTANEIAKELLELLLPDLPLHRGDEATVMVSGLGGTPAMELYILFNRVYELLEDEGISIHRSYVGNYFTSLEMLGATITLMKMDEELRRLVDDPCDSVGLSQF